MDFDLGKTITEAREKSNFSVRRLASLAKVSTAEISRIESNSIKKPNLRIIKSICRYVDLTYNDIVYELGYGATYNPKNKFLTEYYESLEGTNLKSNLIVINQKLKMNNDIITKLKKQFKETKNDELIDLIKSLEYENKTHYYLKKILENKIIKIFLSNN